MSAPADDSMTHYNEAIILNRLFDAAEFVYGYEGSVDLCIYLDLKIRSILVDFGVLPLAGKASIWDDNPTEPAPVWTPVTA